tara:strand:+ start:395 stop:1231 length:837 start_codon:yes stop_codon:yes gene_type:complete
MSLRYARIKNHPRTFSRLFGLSVDQFDTIKDKVEPLFKAKVIDVYERPGRPFKLTVPDLILMVLLYYRSYVSQVFVGYLFGLDDSRVCRLIQKLEPLLCKVMALPDKKSLSKEDIEELLIDATEQPVERPQRGQKAFDEGKKKRHTLKTEVRTTLHGRIIHTSRACPGSVHDDTLHKQGPSLSKKSRVYVDSGYQGLDKHHKKTELPYKMSKNHKLDHDEKEYNRALSRIRVKIEHVLGDIKIFKIMADRYRNKLKRYTIKFQIIAGIVNLKNGFGLI